MTPTNPIPAATPQLLPCPFCGESSARVDDAGEMPLGHGQYQLLYVVHCGCGVEGTTANTPAFAIEFWNRRATATPLVQEAEPVAMHVGDSSFEAWFSGNYRKLGITSKQAARDTYAAGMSDENVLSQLQADATIIRGQEGRIAELEADLAASEAAIFAESASEAEREAQRIALDVYHRRGAMLGSEWSALSGLIRLAALATGVQATEVANLQLARDALDEALKFSPDSERWGRWNRGVIELDMALDAARRASDTSTEVASPVVGRKVADVAIEAIRQLIACHDEGTCPAIDVANQALAALATRSQQEDAQPVAEIAGGDVTYHVKLLPAGMVGAGLPAGTLLYTRAAPPARSSVPLPLNRIHGEARKDHGCSSTVAGVSFDAFVAGVRYAEAAHGIVSPQSPQEREG